jgi:hypothetical protein
MLFDLRSRGRRHTVRVIYLFLALVMVAGLVLVGVGTGSNQGGLLNAFTNNGSGNGQGDAVNAQTKSAIDAVKKHPKSASAWQNLLEARYTAAGTGNGFNDTSDTYTSVGKQQLRLAADAWQTYLKLTSDKPAAESSTLAARVYQNLGDWPNEANAWEYVVQSTTGDLAFKPYICWALSSYAAKRTTTGDLAAAQAVKLSPKLERLTLQSTLKSAKSSPSTAQSTLAEDC